jgi:hypothetical protein
MPLRKLVKVTPKSDRTKQQFVNLMNNNPICEIQERRKDGRLFMSSKHNPEVWIWSDGDDDPHWSYERIA